MGRAGRRLEGPSEATTFPSAILSDDHRVQPRNVAEPFQAPTGLRAGPRLRERFFPLVLRSREGKGRGGAASRRTERGDNAPPSRHPQRRPHRCAASRHSARGSGVGQTAARRAGGRGLRPRPHRSRCRRSDSPVARPCRSIHSRRPSFAPLPARPEEPGGVGLLDGSVSRACPP